MYYLAKIYCQQGRYHESEELALRARERSVKEFGERDPITLGSTTTLAHLYFVQGQYKKAAVLQEQTLESCEALFGEESINTHDVHHTLARTYNKQGLITKAENSYLQGNAGFLKILGDGHKLAIESSAELAEFFLSQGRSQDAIPILEKNIEKCHRVMGGQHSATIKYSSKLGYAYCLISRFEEAELVLKNTQEALEKNFREENHAEPQEDMLSQILAFNTLVTIYHIQGRINEAKPLLDKLAEMATEQDGGNNLIPLRYVENLEALRGHVSTDEDF
jgi:tetratricopeptide (TPR) repeat protein